MQLTNLQYTQFRNKPQHWTLHGFAPGDMTLLVGANASGKSRTLSIIKNLASMVSGKIKMHFSSGEYVATFSDQNKTITYTSSMKMRKLPKKSSSGTGNAFSVVERMALGLSTPRKIINSWTSSRHPTS